MDVDNERNSIRGDSSEGEMSQDSDIIGRKHSSKKNSIGRSSKKSGMSKNPDALEALELATEQTLKVIKKLRLTINCLCFSVYLKQFRL